MNNVVKDSFWTSGEGAAFGADEAQFLATDADTVTMCDVVTVNSHTTTVCVAESWDDRVYLAASYTTGAHDSTYSVLGPATTGVPVAGYVDLHEFTLPNGGTVAIPCVVLVAGPTTNACGAAGGRQGTRLATLGPVTAPLPTSTLVPLVSADVCKANLVLTVNGIGLTSFPAYVLC